MDAPRSTDNQPVIKYIGSKRLLVDQIVDLCQTVAPDGGSVIDLFSGTSRVGHALKTAGFGVHANDHNAYAHNIAMCYIQSDAPKLIKQATKIIDDLNSIARSKCEDGFVTKTYCRDSRFFHPDNGQRIDAMRTHIETLDLGPELKSVVLTSLIEAADRVDSTTGVQMAYLKAWAPRAHKHIELRVPNILPHPFGQACTANQLEATDAASILSADIAYLDPPYNQHSYLGNYHIWETIVRWDHPEVYGIACKRIDCRERKSPYNSKVKIADAFDKLIDSIDTNTLIVSFSDEGYLSRDQIEHTLAKRGPIVVLNREHPRYVGCKIGIHNQQGKKVGKVGKLRNTEYFFIAGAGAQRVADAQKELVAA
ncbi:MAG: DNA adenine methylase [Phycisphaerales bacterium]|nr:DNA adenine methylase [Phycisphaerales bacterium]